MDEHSRVTRWSVIPSDDEYLFRITRTLDGREADVIVHLTDAYRYGLAEFYARPSDLGEGSFIVIGMPHASTDEDVIEEVRRRRIGLGHIGKFMGALNFANIWEYLTLRNAPRESERNPSGRGE